MNSLPMVRVCTTYIPGALGGQKKVSDPLKLGLQEVVSCHLSTGN